RFCGPFDIFSEAGTQVAVLAKGIERRWWNGVHGIRANQLLDINDVAVLGILCARAGPEQTLRLRSLGGKRFPPRASKKFLIFLVSLPCVCDRNFSPEAFEQVCLSGIRSGLELFVDLAINQRIDPADEKAGDARNVADVLALCGTGFE